jgi:hypothetical protein
LFGGPSASHLITLLRVFVSAPPIAGLPVTELPVAGLRIAGPYAAGMCAAISRVGSTARVAHVGDPLGGGWRAAGEAGEGSGSGVRVEGWGATEGLHAQRRYESGAFVKPLLESCGEPPALTRAPRCAAVARRRAGLGRIFYPIREAGLPKPPALGRHPRDRAHEADNSAGEVWVVFCPGAGATARPGSRRVVAFGWSPKPRVVDRGCIVPPKPTTRRPPRRAAGRSTGRRISPGGGASQPGRAHADVAGSVEGTGSS